MPLPRAPSSASRERWPRTSFPRASASTPSRKPYPSPLIQPSSHSHQICPHPIRTSSLTSRPDQAQSTPPSNPPPDQPSKWKASAPDPRSADQVNPAKSLRPTSSWLVPRRSFTVSPSPHPFQALRLLTVVNLAICRRPDHASLSARRLNVFSNRQLRPWNLVMRWEKELLLLWAFHIGGCETMLLEQCYGDIAHRERTFSP